MLIAVGPDAILPSLCNVTVSVGKPRHKILVQSVKQRWIGKRFLDVFASEFSSRPRLYYERAYEKGRLRCYRQGGDVRPGKLRRLDTKKEAMNTSLPAEQTSLPAEHTSLPAEHTSLPAEHTLKGNENVEHECILTEAVVPYVMPIEVVDETEEYLAVTKPPGIPVYPQGQFETNSLTEMLKQKLGRKSFYPLSRLDRVTSGLMIVAKDGKGCQRLTPVVRNWQKFYVMQWSKTWDRALQDALPLRGVFPFSPGPSGPDPFGPPSGPLSAPSSSTGDHIPTSIDPTLGMVVCAPIALDQHTPGSALKTRIDWENGKPSLSIFYLIRDLGTAGCMVLGIPVTGRTHQLRLHSSYADTPIAGDALYNASAAKDTRDHDWYVAVQYDHAETLRYLSLVNVREDVHHFTLTPGSSATQSTASATQSSASATQPSGSQPPDPFPVNDWRELKKDLEKPAEVHSVWVVPRSALRRELSAYPDLCLMDGHLVSFHPFIDPYYIPLHSFAYMTEAHRLITTNTLPSFWPVATDRPGESDAPTSACVDRSSESVDHIRGLCRLLWTAVDSITLAHLNIRPSDLLNSR
ncbi:pseudouridine synthase [Gregarina niphandrodes]|uniref:Pseudouridine synthase n=1 Tax=Gregarina niphandrodes TaxID=110365 RepID=A0A023B7X4_GRENI|nr:pseudouridine synthase [Gregarina niphandrodes]EZG68112.1 pseudouridine synthase [Gregarina niphandrodes]|eukprot:XP_011130097.1 pseudouridine synthase [Gregarina niphandrodes]